MLERGRLEDFALFAASRDAFAELGRRLEAEGAADGDVHDLGTMWIVGFRDPDGSTPSQLAEAWRSGREHARARIGRPSSYPTVRLSAAASGRPGRTPRPPLPSR
jgi:hypothetical protein